MIAGKFRWVRFHLILTLYAFLEGKRGPYTYISEKGRIYTGREFSNYNRIRMDGEKITKRRILEMERRKPFSSLFPKRLSWWKQTIFPKYCHQTCFRFIFSKKDIFHQFFDHISTDRIWILPKKKLSLRTPPFCFHYPIQQNKYIFPLKKTCLFSSLFVKKIYSFEANPILWCISIYFSRQKLFLVCLRVHFSNFNAH